jgi:hypothetical protein
MEKECNSCQVYYQVKGWFQKSQEFLKSILEKGFLKWYDGGGENKLTQKKSFEVKVFPPLKILHPLVQMRDF